MKLKELIKTYARQPSTWRGIAILLAATGVVIDPMLLEQVGMGVIALIGLYETVKNKD